MFGRVPALQDDSRYPDAHRIEDDQEGRRTPDHPKLVVTGGYDIHKQSAHAEYIDHVGQWRDRRHLQYLACEEVAPLDVRQFGVARTRSQPAQHATPSIVEPTR